MYIQASPLLKKSIDEVLLENEPQFLKITAELKSLKDDTFSISIPQLIKLEILDNFIMDYTSRIGITFDIRPIDYMKCVDNYQDLVISLKMNNYDPDTSKTTTPTKEYIYRILFVDKTDKLKEGSKGQIKPSDTQFEAEGHVGAHMTVSAQLIEDEMFLIRKHKINGILNDATVEDGLKFLCANLGIDQMIYQKPDNTFKYKNFILPPLLSISNGPNYIHKRYGLYENGFTYYVKDGCFYAYPAFDEAPKWHEEIVHFYKAPTNSHIGRQQYHKVDGPDTHVVINSGATVKAIGEQFLENSGNIYLVQNAQNIVRNCRTMGEREFTLNTDNFNTYHCKSIAEASENTAMMDYKKSSSNKYVYLSELSSSDIEVVSFSWTHSIPFLIKPGQRIKYHFDGPKKYETREATCALISYDISPMTQLAEKVYGCTSNILLYMEHK